MEIINSSLTSLSIFDASELIRNRKLTPTELIEACLERINRSEDNIHSFVTVTSDQALEAAKKATKEIAKYGARSPLHGIPIAHKDVFMTKGVLTTANSKYLKSWIPDKNAVVVDCLNLQGAITIGKTTCHEFAFGSPEVKDFFPPALNPWNILHVPGSSSSGSAAAVSAGFALGSTGTDTGGSIRHPAAACGLVGLKPTRALIPLEGVIALAPSLDHAGPITRTVRDNYLLLQGMLGKTSNTDILKKIIHSIKNIRLGVAYKNIAEQNISHEVHTAFTDAIEVFKKLGAKIVEINPKSLSQAPAIANKIINYEAYLQLQKAYHEQPENLGEGLLKKLDQAREIEYETYQEALISRRNLEIEFSNLFDQQVDGIISIGREFPPETMNELMNNPTGPRSSCNRIYSLTGNPALTLPMGFSSKKLPLAIQIATNHYKENLLYQISGAYEDATKWVSESNNAPWN
jgi:aspartyl-tRNA(Asn)/glutamyl-tRNA(Gln) amidotransferase subunit A